jgi:hypothetical protein
MIGNVWTAQRFEQLRRAARESGLHLDWYGNGPAAKWLKGAPEEWEADNIRCMGYLPEEDLVAALASYPFIVVPSGSMDPDDDNLAFSYLSLPSRLLFLHASTDTPVLVLGSRNSAAGRFTLRLGTGLCSGYSAAELRATRQELLRPEVRAQLSANIRRWAPTFVMPNAGEWIWQSLAAGRPQPAGFHAAFAESAPVEFAGLTRLGRVPAQPAPEHPKAGEAYRDTFASSFRFARAHHLEVIRHHDSGLPAAEALDLTRYQGAAAHYIVAGSVKPGGDVLFIGADAPPGIQTLASTHRVWRLRDHAKWRVDGFAGDPAYVESLSGTEAYPPQFPQFDAIVSTGWCGEIPDDPHVLEGLSLYLQACTRPGGINAHFFSAVLHGTYFWTGAGHAYLQRRFAPAPGWRTLDELLWQRDLFFMSEAVYHEHWERATGRSYGEFGRPLSLGLIWRQR